MIQCCSLSKRFENVEAVKDISMQVPDGTFLGLLGYERRIMSSTPGNSVGTTKSK